MKRILPVLCCIISFTFSFGQPYGNEWINYDQEYLKFNVSQDGIYRIDYTTLDNALSGIGVSLATIDPRNFQIFNKGTEQYIYISGEADGVFNAADFIEFFGEQNDGSTDTPLFDSAQWQLHTYTSIITDTATYFLTWNNLITNNRIFNVTNDLAGAPAAQPYNIYHSLVVYGSPYGSGYFNGGPPHLDVLSSKYEDGEGYASYKFSLSTFNISIGTPNIYTGPSFTPTLKTTAMGVNLSSHHVVIDFNGLNLVDSTFSNYKVLRYNFDITNLVDNNLLTFISGPLSTDYQRYSFADITYPHTFDFDNASKIQLDLPITADPTTYLEFTDFDEKATSPILYDLNSYKRIVAIVETDISKFHIPYSTDDHKFFMSSQDPSDILNITSMTPVSFIDYSEIVNQGNFLLISHKDLFDDGTGINWVDEYKNYRNSLEGGLHNTKVIDIDQLYDQFYYGLKKHPLAIRNFILYAADNFASRPDYVFLIGKSYSYDVTRAYATPEYAADLVPTFGHPGADNLLSARPGSVVPEIPIGRISARTGNDIKSYLDKVIEYEAAQADHMQTIENKAWMKNVLHFAGGLTPYEQSLFNSFLTQYAYTIEDTLYGGNVTPFNKLSTDPIFYSESEYIDSLVNNGVSLITFFGHSSTGSFDYNIGEPEEFSNEGKYFTVYGNGCNTSAIHGESITLGERYIFSENKGAIAFIAASNFSLASSLHTYATWFYKELASLQYHKGLGDVIKATSDTMWPTLNIYDQLTLEHTTLQGDPSLKLNTHDLPDYAIEPQYVYFEPDIISAGVDTFYLNIIVTNLGRAIDSSYFVEVKRTKPTGIEETFLQVFHATYFRDTLRIPFATDVLNGIGLNDFDIHIDKLNGITELDELNNILSTNTYIISDDAIPIYPVEFSIMNHIPEYLAASTSYVFADEKEYIIEIDTTMNFNSPFHESTHVLQSGGVVKWMNPPVIWVNNLVYYWRITPDTSDGTDVLWRSSSFLYLPGEITGWNQSHYFQYLEDEYKNIALQPTRIFEFVPDVNTYNVSTGVYPGTYWFDVTSYLDGELVAVSSCVSTGFVVFVADASSGEPWTTHEIGTTNTGPYGDYYCSGDAYEKIIQFWTNTPANREILYQFMMNTIPDSNYIICYSNGYPDFYAWMDDTAIYGHNLYDAFTAYGATDILSLTTYDYDRSYIFSAKKGDPATKVEIIGDSIGTTIELSVVVIGNWNEGTVESTLIGPATYWDKAQWSYFAHDNALMDTNYVEIIGVSISGVETVLSSGLTSGDTTIAFIDPLLYPYIKLRLNTKDDSLRTPAQYNYWRVIYTPVPEAALNPNVHYTFSGDSVDQGQLVDLSFATTNVSDYDMDSLLIQFNVRDQNNILHPIPFTRQDSLLSDQTMISTLQFSTKPEVMPPGKNTLIVEVNPNNDQPEQYHFNNLAYIPFYNAPDVRNPLLDVTFDGVHIFDGDIVSAKPFILISMKDENRYLALGDTSLLRITIEYPDNSLHDFYYDGNTTKFYPADTSDLAEINNARVEMYPTFEADGIYVLQIHGEDVSGNNAGELDYRISFEVINKAMISNVMNYPNPFTTQTRFVFTLTGSEIPDYFKIQIMTVSGKIIREIMRSELGELHIGNNITEFSWDGTDKYGDQLANGLYLYRVVTKLNGKALEKYDTNTDTYFKSGYGKMYLVR
ncbi:MAG: C25 family cysteine peptidase [Chitinophagales bacterium]